MNSELDIETRFNVLCSVGWFLALLFSLDLEGVHSSPGTKIKTFYISPKCLFAL